MQVGDRQEILRLRFWYITKVTLCQARRKWKAYQHEVLELWAWSCSVDEEPNGGPETSFGWPSNFESISLRYSILVVWWLESKQTLRLIRILASKGVPSLVRCRCCAACEQFQDIQACSNVTNMKIHAWMTFETFCSFPTPRSQVIFADGTVVHVYAGSIDHLSSCKQWIGILY